MLTASVAVAADPKDPSYDQQIQTYMADRTPARVSGQSLTLTPIFSPDTALTQMINHINSAQVSLDIGTPGACRRTTFAHWRN